MFKSPIAPSIALILVAFGLASTSPAAAEERPDAFVVYGGFDAAPEALYIYQGLLVSLNRDLGKDGLMLRFSGGLAAYQYALEDVTGGEVNGNLWQVDLMLGYQVVRGPVTTALYVGVDFQDAQLTPDDPSSEVRGEEVGAKVAGSVFLSDDNLPYEAMLLGQYSTAFETYYAQLRVGLELCDKLFVGPEGAVIGATGYDAQRLGGYAKYTFDLTPDIPLSLTLSGGHQFVSDSEDGGGTLSGPGGGEGTYGAIGFATVF